MLMHYGLTLIYGHHNIRQSNVRSHRTTLPKPQLLSPNRSRLNSYNSHSRRRNPRKTTLLLPQYPSLPARTTTDMAVKVAWDNCLACHSRRQAT